MRKRATLRALGAAAGVWLLVAQQTDAATFTHLPAEPVSSSPIALRIDDETSTLGGGNRVGPHKLTIIGAIVRVEGCVGTAGAPVGGPYSVTLPAGPLPVGEYVVEYYRSVDLGNAQCTVVDRSGLEFRGRAVLSVRPAQVGGSPAVRPVHEYVHEGFLHYFMTADPDEQLTIELGRFRGWRRLGPLPWWRDGDGFALFTQPAPDRVPICRFYSEAFVPKSTHFYTPDAAECEVVKQNPRWVFEGIAGFVWPVRPDGGCDQGKPLYRLYNNGLGGAPNHRYVVERSMRDSMVTGGWIPEGQGTGVIACVPPRPSSP